MIKEFVLDLLKKSLQQNNFPNVEIIIEVPKNSQFGDLSTNVAMQLTKTLHRPPRDIAQEIIDKINIDSEIFEKIDIAGAGFINFKFTSKYLTNILHQIYNIRNDYGKFPQNGKKANVEYVSANPTGLLHLGHGRNAVIGDTIANLLELIGYDVTREYYFNNAGNQMRNLANSVFARIKQLTDEPNFDMPQDGYFGEYIIDIAKDYITQNNIKAIEKNDETLFNIQKFAENWNFAKIKETLHKLNIHQDEFYNENSLYETGKIESLLEELKQKGLSYEKDGAVWLKFSELGLDQDRVIVKSTGEPTYRLPDIAYHREKFLRGFDLIVDIFGADHIATVPDVLAAIRALGFDDKLVKVVIHQFVTLTENGQQVKMSKRSGRSYTLDELIDEVGADVVRFFFLMRGVNTHLEFDLALAKEQSEKNPVFYLQYAHARMCSILAKINEPIQAIDLAEFNHPNELSLIKKIDEFPEAIQNSARNFEPHILADYLRDLAGEFHLFYHNCRIIGEDIETMHKRLILLETTKSILANGLKALGISAPERM